MHSTQCADIVSGNTPLGEKVDDRLQLEPFFAQGQERTLIVATPVLGVQQGASQLTGVRRSSHHSRNGGHVPLRLS